MRPDRERLARVLSNAPFPSARSLGKIDAILSDIRAQGYRIVPEVPTERMIEWGMEQWALSDNPDSEVERIYTAMLNAHEETRDEG